MINSCDHFQFLYKFGNFIALSFSSFGEFIPLLTEHMTVKSFCPPICGWMDVLDSVPNIDMHDFLLDFLDGNEKGITGKFVGLN